MSVTLLGIID